MTRRFLCMLVLLGMMFSIFACGARSDGENSASDELEIYRIINREESTYGAVLETESYTLKKGDDRLHTALNLLEQTPYKDGLKKALPDGVSILSYSMDAGELTLELSGEYLKLSGMEKTLADYSMVLTLCALEDVDAVSVYVEGQPVSEGMTENDVLLYDTETDPHNKQIRLYFSMTGGRYLTQEYHTLSVDKEISIERYVMEELLRGPNSPGMYSSIPQGTRLLEISTEDGECTVELSYEFYRNRPSDRQSERLAVYTIVNSLTALTNIDSVRIRVEGWDEGVYYAIDLSRPLERNDSIVYSEDPGDNTEDVNMYFVSDDGKLVSLPRTIELDGYISLEQNVAQQLMSDSGEAGYASAFFAGNTVISAVTKDSVCIVDVSKAFFAGLTYSETDVQIAALTATLTSLNGVEYVRLTLDGGDAVFNGRNYSGLMSVTKNN